MRSVRKPWWQQATALVTVSAGGVITGFNFVPGAAATMNSPTSVPLHLLALEQAAHPGVPGGLAAGAGGAGQVASDAQLRAAIVNVARYYLLLAKTKTPAQMEALIWDKTSSDGADHGPSCAAFASLTLELAAQTAGLRSWVSGGATYPWPMPAWADVRVDTNPASPAITSMVADAQEHGRWHPLADGYQPQPGDWALYEGHVEVVTGYVSGVLDTIGADSLPGFTVNAHSSGAPLAEQGVRGFIDNGNLPPAGGSSPGTASNVKAAPRAHAAERPGGGPHLGVTRQRGDAAVPGVPAAAALSGSGGIPGAGAAPGGGQPEAHAAAAVPGLPAPAASAAAGHTRGMAFIPGTSGLTATAPAKRAHPARAAAPAAGQRAGAPAGASAPGTASGGQYATPGTSEQQAFISLVAPGAVAAQQRYGVPAAVTIAQAIEESAWGHSSLAGRYHNLFGIKGTGPAGSVTLPTAEYSAGQWVTVNALFRAYHNDAESIADHAELLATSGYYTRAMADRAVPDAFANDLTGVYATDPHYGENLIALMKLYNLYQYDAASVPAATAPGTPAPVSRPARQESGTGSSPGAGRIPGLVSPPAATSGTPGTPGTSATAHPGGTRPSGLVTAAYVSPARPAGTRAAGTRAATGHVTPARAAGGRAGARWYEPRLPQAVATALFANAKGPLAKGEHLYRDVAARADVSWKLLAAVDWMQCKADPRHSPVAGEKLGALNDDGTCYPTKSAALAQCASDLVELTAAVYGIDLTARRPLAVRELAAAFAAFRWGAILRRHNVSPMEFPYSVAGLTSAHQKMRWPPVDAPDAPDRPGGRFRQPFGAVPVVLSLGYPATVS